MLAYQTALEIVPNRVTTPSVLAYPDFNLSSVLNITAVNQVESGLLLRNFIHTLYHYGHMCHALTCTINPLTYHWLSVWRHLSFQWT